ncbi:extracellular_matrix protein [Hexamita inflata]|uniref:Extracellular matrix protein n=1 Tax=Hexamita inflata TaxID=28002 RepID=A0AA86Q2K7_9EUKA|nr:extracellular matrix protein [Hexamita inflata]
MLLLTLCNQILVCNGDEYLNNDQCVKIASKQLSLLGECAAGASCGPNQVCINDECVCDSSTGYGQNGASCYLCAMNNKVSVNGQCQDCYTGAIKDNGQCYCSQDLGYVGGDSTKCVSCWDKNQPAIMGGCVEKCYVGTYFEKSANQCVCDESQGYIGANFWVCVNCWDVFQIAKDSQCQQCTETGTVFKAGKCACNEQLGYGGANQAQQSNSQCVLCWDNQQVVVQGYCQLCGYGTFYDENSHSCLCDNQQGFSGSDPNNCQDCWGQNQIIVNGLCQSCQSYNMVVNNECVCNEYQGYVGQALSCDNCWNMNQIIVNGKCQECKPGTKFSSSKKECVCDEQLGYAGFNAASCENCWQMQKIVDQGECKPCEHGKIFSDNNCICDESIGFAGDQTCEDCWSNSMVISDQKCVECADIDEYSTYTTENNCSCLPKYIFQNNKCKMNGKNKTIAIAVAVPLLIILVSVVTTFIVLKKKKNQKKTEKEPTNEGVAPVVPVTTDVVMF